MPVVHWSLLSKSARTARSSHCASATKSGLLVVYGGELKPRVPVDSATTRTEGPIRGSVHVFDTNAPKPWQTLDPQIDPARSVPDARVGASMVAIDGHLYLWGGRGGVNMAPLAQGDAGWWRGEVSIGGASPATVVWDKVEAVNPDESPEPRSYHTAAAYEGKIYVHAGCPASGRLSSLHSFDVQTRRWQQLASAPEPARGGTSLVAASVKHWGPVLLRYGGFSGYELPSTPGVLDVYSIHEDKWRTVQPAADPVHGHPGSRSVHGFAKFQSSSPGLASALAVLFHGERDASSLGHAGAGKFWSDVWLLNKDAAAEDGEAGWAWQKVDVLAQDVADRAATPEGRGWFASTEVVDNVRSRVFMHGGLLSSNERSDELWELQIE
ncbi:galactose oxidase [Wolfiporia cocos MD-104 SS10]|uniref:Galactose oxidase n=1 Tax=Wolfiporia cocos (strain MD-104) TaxID=742152 RepID=A0A2H3J924_WOLCO|nr:galactose oxidase [Wolfiporia cocos MD-104 SS10]